MIWRKLALVLALLVAACGGRDRNGAVAKEVSGSLIVDGKSMTVTRCLVKHDPLSETRLVLFFAGGSLSYQKDRVYLDRSNNRSGIVRGRQLVCRGITGERVSGSSTNGPGFMHGTLAGECSAPTPVKFDLTLRCGTIDAKRQRQLEELKRRPLPK